MPEQDHKVGRRSDYNSDKREAAAKLRLEEGLTQDEIAQRLGVSRGRVGKYLRDMGIRGFPPRRSNPRRKDRMELLRFAAEQWDVLQREFDLVELLDRYERKVATQEDVAGTSWGPEHPSYDEMGQ